MPKDLRHYLDIRERNGDILRFTKPVDAETEAGALLNEVNRSGQIGLIQNMRGREGQLVYNLLGRREWIAEMMGVEVHELPGVYRAKMRQLIPPERVSEGPSQAVVWLDREIDLTRLPLIVHSEKDAGTFISGGIVIAEDPDTGIRNVSMNRLEIKGPRLATIRSMPPQHLGIIIEKYKARGERMPMVVAFGHYPLDLIAAATSWEYGKDELELAGALRGEPFPLVPGKTVPIDVPAYAELIIEGYVDPSERLPEGPFGDFLWFYTLPDTEPAFHVTAITHRPNPILQAIHPGTTEDVNLLGLSREAQILAVVEHTGARIRDIRLFPTILGCTVAIDQQYQGEAKNVGMAALAVYRWLKYCIVVDHDVDPGDLQQVLWAVATRSNPERSIGIMGGISGFPRDPHNVHTSKAVIDATIPLGQWREFERKAPPNAGKVHIVDFL